MSAWMAPAIDGPGVCGAARVSPKGYLGRARRPPLEIIRRRAICRPEFASPNSFRAFRPGSTLKRSATFMPRRRLKENHGEPKPEVYDFTPGRAFFDLRVRGSLCSSVCNTNCAVCSRGLTLLDVRLRMIAPSREA